MPLHDARFFAALTERAATLGAGGQTRSTINFAVELGDAVPKPGKGCTLERWRVLAAVADGDVGAARIVEPHLDALAILDEAGHSAGQGSWGVFAAKRAGLSLTARPMGDGRFELSGCKPWCSLGAELDSALVTATTVDGSRLFAVDLAHGGITSEPATKWVARGLSAIPSVSLHFNEVPAVAVGPSGWYLARAGFAWGGIGVAACWYGGASALVQALRTAIEASPERSGDPLAQLALGRADLALFSVHLALEASAAAIDSTEASAEGIGSTEASAEGLGSTTASAEVLGSGRADAAAGRLLAARVRSLAAAAAEEILSVVARTLGPEPLAFDEAHARRVADLSLYVRQHHGERDIAALGRLVTGRQLP